METFKHQVVEKLRDLEVIRQEGSGRAAVLVPVFFQEEKPWLLLTRRSLEVATHKGQVCFPGGFQEETDSSLLHTALRETREELGIEADFIEVAGRFHDYVAAAQCAVTPFVGFLREGFSITRCAREVESVIAAPLEFFLQTPPRRQWRQGLEKPQEVLYYNFQGQVIWGLTARIIHDLLPFVGDWPAARV